MEISEIQAIIKKAQDREFPQSITLEWAVMLMAHLDIAQGKGDIQAKARAVLDALGVEY